MSTEPKSFCTARWRTGQQDLAVTFASCETCPFCGDVEHVVGHMQKLLFECTVLIAQSIGLFKPQGRAATSPSTTNDRTHLRGERCARKCAASGAQSMQRGSAWVNWSLAATALARHEATVINSKSSLWCGVRYSACHVVLVETAFMVSMALRLLHSWLSCSNGFWLRLFIARFWFDLKCLALRRVGSGDTLWPVGTLERRQVVSTQHSATGSRRVMRARCCSEGRARSAFFGAVGGGQR